MKRNRLEIKKLLDKLGIKNYNQKAMDIFNESLTHSSYKNENKNKCNYDYERLEILGDAIIQKIVTEYLFSNFPDYSEGKITEERKKIVQEKTMVEESEKLNLIQFTFLGNGINIIKDTQKIKADLFESVIGAIYLTQGEEFCKKIIIETIIKNIQEKTNDDVIDYKTKIQEIFQMNNQNNSFSYTIEKRSDNLFYVKLIYGKSVLGKGNGKTKKEAERQAAKQAFLKYQCNDLKNK